MRREEITLREPPDGDRPSNRFKCGRLGQDDACPHGPSSKGVCPFLVQEKNGPSACRPTRTWVGKRKRVSAFVFTIAIATLIGVGWLTEAGWWAKPGPLTSAHAQLLTNLTSQGPSEVRNQSCATCHEQAALDPWAFLKSGGESHVGVTLSSKCIDCHHTTIPRDRAMMAHNLPAKARQQIREAIVRNVSESASGGWSNHWLNLSSWTAPDSENIECSVCHREHHGSDADITAMADAQCQSCHASAFGDFATSHPPFRDWPAVVQHNVAFDHASHYGKHFLESASNQSGKSSWVDCQQCHSRDNHGVVERRVAYQQCASCHDEKIQVATAKVDFFQLPTLPEEVFAGEANKKWPEVATGWMDGRLSPWVMLMLRGDGLSDADFGFAADGDLSRLDVENEHDRRRARRIAGALANLLRDVNKKGQQAFVDRLSKLGVDRSVGELLFGHLPPQLIDSATETWFGGESDGGQRFDADEKLPSGGWYRDDLTLQIAYRGTGHADPVVQGLTELAMSLNPQDPLRKVIAESASVQSCTRCHVSALQSRGHWTSPRFPIQSNLLTKFDHAPHLTSKQGIGCTDCHRLSLESESPNPAQLASVRLMSNSSVNSAEVSSDPVGGRLGLEAIQKASCVACHNARATEDRCVTCHRYHAPLAHGSDLFLQVR